jgi:Rrf2 family nitric oxide-sensitive transcriptional repressor
LAKVAQMLVQEGWVSSRRGRDGGLLLTPQARDIRLGALVRRTESHDLLECFDRKTSSCALTGACHVERALREAREAFFAVLDRYTLAELVANKPQLLQLIARAKRNVAS